MAKCTCNWNKKNPTLLKNLACPLHGNKKNQTKAQLIKEAVQQQIQLDKDKVPFSWFSKGGFIQPVTLNDHQESPSKIISEMVGEVSHKLVEKLALAVDTGLGDSWDVYWKSQESPVGTCTFCEEPTVHQIEGHFVCTHCTRKLNGVGT